MKQILALVCVYEAGAIWSGRYPTVTAWSARSRLVAFGILTAMAVHFELERQRLGE